MSKIAIWYHGLFTGNTVPIDLDYACRLIEDQMRSLKGSALLSEADEFHISINGDNVDANMARLFCPCPVAKYHANGPEAHTEIPTLNRLRNWLPEHPDWYVLYLHMKCVSRPNDELCSRWRRCMEKHLIWGWRECVAHLNQGIDSCGCHWLTPHKHPGLVKTPFWGGNFWWAKAKFLLTLPILPEDKWGNRFAAENWIGSGPQYPSVIDFHKQWPSMACDQ